MKLIDNANKAWRMLSMQAMTGALAVQSAWGMVPEDMKGSIPPNVVMYLTMGLVALGIVGRLVKQDSVSGGISTEDKNEVHP